MDERNAGPGPKPKVARLIEKYDLEGVGDDLAAQWTAPEDRTGLRGLAESFNERLLRAALAREGIDTITEDVGNLYALLAGERGSRGERTQVERQLERKGVDVSTLREEFVSYGAIRSYLVNYRGVAPPSAQNDPSRDRTAQTIEGLRRRTVTVSEGKLARLQETDRLRIGSHRVLVDVQVLCEECGKQYEITSLLESGACDCFES
ncbi:rod-determining factor RdfA [Natrarchaeobius sp. A-rgal3]|uniref:rod-determining factor RdfA n=1 Tax=Natrarchaeobius versutus TaxID=1679078 RepID=UPI00350F4B3D